MQGFDIDRSGWIRRSHFETKEARRGKVVGGAIADANAGSEEVVRQMSVAKVKPLTLMWPSSTASSASWRGRQELGRKLGYSQFLEFTRASSPRSRRSGSTTWRMRTGASRTNRPSAGPPPRPLHIKLFMQKNMTHARLVPRRLHRLRLLRRLRRVIQHLQLFEAIIEQVGLKQRRITKRIHRRPDRRSVARVARYASST